MDLGAALGKMPMKPAMGAEPAADDGGEMETIASELIDAVKAGDAAAVASALRAAHACASGE